MKTLAEVEREHLVEAMKEAEGVQAKAAELLGLSRWALHRRLGKHDIGPPDWHPEWQGGET